MDIVLKILKQRLDKGLTDQIYVKGNSMNPILQESDCITLTTAESYFVGDILVFIYKSGRFLVHRLLQINNGVYYCKGDNSFRLEEVCFTQIFGKVISVRRKDNNVPLPTVSEAFIKHSLQVNQEFIRCRYNVKKTMDTKIYKEYYSEYISSKDVLDQL